MLTIKRMVSLVLAISIICMTLIPANASIAPETDDFDLIDMVGELSIPQSKLGSAEKREISAS